MAYPNTTCIHALVVVTLVLLLAMTREAEAHNGGVILQLSGDKLVTGYDNEAGIQTMGDRAFTVLLPPSLANDVPSFISFASAPAGSEPLPGGVELFWDFLPMTHNGLTSDLLYWDGVGTMQEDIEFGALPQNDITMSLYTEGFTDHTEINGDPEMVAGYKLGTVATSGSNLRLHAHRWWFMDSVTSVPEGVYLASMQVRMPGYKATDPFYVMASTDAAALDLALPWADNHADSLILDGDYNFDGYVSGTDFLAWQLQFGMQQQYPNGPFPVNGAYADGDGSGIVDDGDLTEWEMNFGSTPAPALAAFGSVPEPSSLLLVLLGSSVVFNLRLRKPELQ